MSPKLAARKKIRPNPHLEGIINQIPVCHCFTGNQIPIDLQICFSFCWYLFCMYGDAMRGRLSIPCAVQSQGSISSISTSNRTLDSHGSVAAANAPTEFLNHGLLLWNQIRQRWVGNRKCENRKREVQEPKLNWNATYESLLGSNKPFPQPIPLSEMIDFLVDAWEQDGLYD
ncbi:hypothetical protein V6N13_083963 [Hibiscus sabdariffa]|uniref:Gag1-like clamp domain-containing protein n=1 Tax=Hibiscus sabdariffa TaxID=183260 RepID=A0ABR2T0B2_9ROSI